LVHKLAAQKERKWGLCWEQNSDQYLALSLERRLVHEKGEK
jgi:hypothetical protein